MANAEAVEMEKELYVAAMNGSVGFLEDQNDEYLLRKTRQNRNVLHVATQYEQLEFIKAILVKFPNNYKLITDRETSNENTPLHIAAEVGNSGIMSILYDYSKGVECHEGEESQPWKLKNARGNTLVHVALLHDNLKVARDLLEKDPEYAFILNESYEAPLHVAIKQHVNRSKSESMLVRIKQPVHEGGAGLPVECEVKEDMSSMIKLLVQKASSVASWPDAKGLTPLLRAASLDAPYNLQTTKLLIEHCPQSAAVCNATGKSILHLLINKIPYYHDASSLLTLIEIFSLRNHQDQHGNTPLHVAAKNKDINMVRALLETKANLDIKNSDGISVASLIQQQDVLQMLRQREMTEEEGQAADRADIAFLEERMSKLGTDFVLSKYSDKKNFLHKLMHMKSESRINPSEFIGFVKKILEIVPALVSQTDQNGNTPIHILMQNNHDTKIYFVSENPNTIQQTNNRDLNTTNINPFIVFSLELLERCNKCIVDEAPKNKEHYKLPWLVKNAAGNTPLHEALIAENKALALKLLEYDQNAAAVVNSFKETPLHLLAQNNQVNQFKKEDIVKMVEANKEAAKRPDKDGLSPILRAFRADNLSTAAILCDLSPEALAIVDADGNTFWHLLVKHRSRFFLNRLLKKNALRRWLRKRDADGNTPLHLAMQDKRFDIVKDFLKTWDQERDELNGQQQGSNWLLDLLGRPNKAGITPGDLIAEETSLPFEIEELILKDPRMRGMRSAWNISRSQLNNYMNSMNVIAALLTTITFTAAFTVPGGLIQDIGLIQVIGTPILIRSTAFKTFMISDVVAMCLSMTVLICLLWIMAISNKRESVMIQDFTVTLLLAAFVATLLTFAAGVYATIFPVNHWIAIATVVLCSLTALLVIRKIITKLLLPVRNATLNFYMMVIRKIAGKVQTCVKSTDQSSSSCNFPSEC